jgi:hypothetical protein
MFYLSSNPFFSAKSLSVNEEAEFQLIYKKKDNWYYHDLPALFSNIVQIIQKISKEQLAVGNQ